MKVSTLHKYDILLLTGEVGGEGSGRGHTSTVCFQGVMEEMMLR